MSGAYVRELLIDKFLGKLDFLESIDIELGINKLLATKQITKLHAKLAYLYTIGYSLIELQAFIPNADELLIEFFSLLSVEIKYEDDYVMQYALRLYPKYAKSASAFRKKLESYSREF